MTPPRFISFEVMTPGQQREHLQRVHGCHRYHDGLTSASHCHQHGPWGGDQPIPPHTHDKPARRTA